MSNENIWFVRAGRGGMIVDQFLAENMVGVGWAALGEIGPDADRTALLERAKRVYPTWKLGTQRNGVSQSYRFSREIQVGDFVMTYAPSDRRYYLGRIESEVTFDPVGDDYSCRRHQVAWTEQVRRDAMSETARNRLGSILTLFKVDAAVFDELKSNATPIDEPDSPDLDSGPPSSTQQSSSSDERGKADETDESNDYPFGAELLDKAQQAIEDKLIAFAWDDMERLIAGILDAMGYKSTVSAPGGDRGVDIFASKDGLGLEEPRIFVEVKHRRGKIGSQQIRSFIGGRNISDRCLYVSTGGFTHEAKYEAERSNVPLKLLTLPDIRKLLLEHYEDLNTELRTLIPLRRAYLPIE